MEGAFLGGESRGGDGAEQGTKSREEASYISSQRRVMRTRRWQARRRIIHEQTILGGKGRRRHRVQLEQYGTAFDVTVARGVWVAGEVADPVRVN